MGKILASYFCTLMRHITNKQLGVYSTCSRLNNISNMADSSLQTVDGALKEPTKLSVDDWKDKYWAQGNIKFHKDYVHPLLEKHFDKMINGRTGIKILVPLCGKSVDIKWMADQGHEVVGVDTAEQAVKEYFQENGLEVTIDKVDAVNGDLYKSKDNKIRLYCCDLFDFSSSVEKDFDAVWDRGSIVAVNVGDRERYVALLKSLSAPTCRKLVVTHHYDPSEMAGPPHYFAEGELTNLYGSGYKVEAIEERDIMDSRWEEKGLSSHKEIISLIS